MKNISIMIMAFIMGALIGYLFCNLMHDINETNKKEMEVTQGIDTAISDGRFNTQYLRIKPADTSSNYYNIPYAPRIPETLLVRIVTQRKQIYHGKK